MKYLLNILSVVFVGWPAVVAGYVFYTVKHGFIIGYCEADRHEAAAIQKFCKRNRHD